MTGRRASVNRLRRSADFASAVRSGQRYRGTRLVLYVARTDGPTRAGFVAGRSVGGAVRRNRARRLLKEAWRELAPDSGEGFDLVMVATRDAWRSRTPEVRDEMRALLERAAVLGPS